MRLSEHDCPIEECVKVASEKIRQGAHTFQKFTCEKCLSRQTMDVPDVFYSTGRCQECGHVSNIMANGCNYAIVGRFNVATGRFVQDDKIETAVLAIRGDVVSE